MHESIEKMFEEITTQKRLFSEDRIDLSEQCKNILSQIDPKSIDKVYIAGCGDSFYAGINLRELFVKYAGVHAEACQALEFSRYICPYEVDSKSMVICISNSGKVSRTIECALCADKKGAVAVGFTGTPGSPMAQACKFKVVTKVPQWNSECVLPGTYTYTASMMALTCMAIELGVAKGKITAEKAEELYKYVADLGECIEPTVVATDKIISNYLDIYADPSKPDHITLLHYLGSGPNWGNAQYASEKMLEAAAFDAVCQGIEEWAHTQYFTTRKTTHTVIIAPKGRARDRVIEIAQAVTVMDGKKVIIGEDGDKELRRSADIYIPICGMENILEEFSPLIYMVPIGLIAMHIGRVLNVQAFSFNKPWVQEENLRQIWDSKIVTDMD